MIFKMLRDNRSLHETVSYVIARGYSHSAQSLAGYVRTICEDQFLGRPSPVAKGTLNAGYPDNAAVFARTLVFRALVSAKKPEETKENEQCLASIMKKYPVCAEVGEAFLEFHGAIMGGKTEKPGEAMEKNRKGPLSGFWGAIERDIIPARNAIAYKYNSGFVGETIQKLKLIEKVLYGKCGLENLAIRTRLAFKTTLEGFTLYDVMGCLQAEW